MSAFSMPELVEPMVAATGELPDTDAAEWGLELKWDGVRVVTYVDGKGGVRATARRGAEVTGHYPELSVIGDLIPHQGAVLDGEVVAFDSTGRPDFGRLQHRMHVAAPHPRLVREVPVHYVVFDLLYLDGHTLYDVPYSDRRELLDDLELTAGPIEAPSYLRADDAEQVAELVDYTREQRLEGLVAKRLGSPYRPGKRVDYWRKVKNFHTQEVVIGGWKPGKGRRAGGIGSLLLGVHDKGALQFVGHVGTGFTDRALADLAELLRPLSRSTSPFAPGSVPYEFARGARWVEPRKVGEVTFISWTADGRLRAPSWRGLRSDLSPASVTREPGL
ncbi:MAG: bifunctional non-ous end joining protein LigD [Streptosporangiaceae bacterium]|jgi:bifunctional non-homologous end joining protein LigD|nr:bifunctional non-ous end joining protein LigD [Streptosporangiaceae bacterium]